MNKDRLHWQNRRNSRTNKQVSQNLKTAPKVPRSYYWWPITAAKIRQAVQKIVDAAHPEKVILFGSFANGQPTPDSDVDLLVIMQSDQNAHARAVQISEILYPRPFPVDIIVRTPEEVAERLALGDGFFHEIMTNGKVLYDRTRD
jgi:predicted nucleotidyltransferase